MASAVSGGTVSPAASTLRNTSSVPVRHRQAELAQHQLVRLLRELPVDLPDRISGLVLPEREGLAGVVSGPRPGVALALLHRRRAVRERDADREQRRLDREEALRAGGERPTARGRTGPPYTPAPAGGACRSGRCRPRAKARSRRRRVRTAGTASPARSPVSRFSVSTLPAAWASPPGVRRRSVTDAALPCAARSGVSTRRDARFAARRADTTERHGRSSDTSRIASVAALFSNSQSSAAAASHSAQKSAFLRISAAGVRISTVRSSSESTCSVVTPDSRARCVRSTRWAQTSEKTACTSSQIT